MGERQSRNQQAGSGFHLSALVRVSPSSSGWWPGKISGRRGRTVLTGVSPGESNRVSRLSEVAWLDSWQWQFTTKKVVV
jgi:hypothetical protein